MSGESARQFSSRNVARNSHSAITSSRT
jgi:hypothetical protein